MRGGSQIDKKTKYVRETLSDRKMQPMGQPVGGSDATRNICVVSVEEDHSSFPPAIVHE